MMTATTFSGEFKLVERLQKKNKKNRKRYNKTIVDEDIDVIVSEHLRSVDRKLEQLKASKFYTYLVDKCFDLCTDSKFNCIKCLALGSPSHIGGMPMYQLALLLLLAERFQVERYNISVWDPVFTDVDRLIFDKLKIRVDESEVDINPLTLLYMPHAPSSLIEDTLKQVYTESNLSGTHYILGNYIPVYDIRLTAEDKQDKYPHIGKVIQSLGSTNDEWAAVDIPDSLIKHDHWYQAFNDLALHRYIKMNFISK